MLDSPWRESVPLLEILLDISFFFAYNIYMALTKRQKEFLDFLAGFLEKRGYSPSYEEIAHGLDLASLATVHKHILALEAKNYLKRGFNRSPRWISVRNMSRNTGGSGRWRFRYSAESPRASQ